MTDINLPAFSIQYAADMDMLSELICYKQAPTLLERVCASMEKSTSDREVCARDKAAIAIQNIKISTLAQ